MAVVAEMIFLCRKLSSCPHGRLSLEAPEQEDARAEARKGLDASLTGDPQPGQPLVGGLAQSRSIHTNMSATSFKSPAGEMLVASDKQQNIHEEG